MFCKNCGAKIDDDALFCDSCGARQQEAPAQPVYDAAPAPAKKKPPVGLFIGIGAGALAVIVAVILIIALAGKGGGGTSSPEKLAKNVLGFYTDLYTDGSAEASDYLSYFPDSYVKKFASDNGLSTSELKKKVQKKIDQAGMLLQAFMPDDYRVTGSKIESVEDIDREDIEEMVEKYGLAITDAKKVKMTISYTAEGENDENDMRLIVIKVGGKWYIEPGSLEDMLE